MSRREQLEEMLKEDPNDQFLRYMLANELGKGDAAENEQALEVYRGLTADTPPYVPAFLISAQLLQRLQRVDEAATVLRTGIEEARRQDELHAASEMGELLAQL